MRPEEATAFIIDKVDVTHQSVTIAKAYALTNYAEDTDSIFENFMRSIDAQVPREVVIQASIDPLPTFNRIAMALSWQLAMSEAIWGLIHANMIVPMDFGNPRLRWNITWKTDHGQEGMDFSGLELNVPRRTKLAPSWRANKNQILADGDLYMHEMNIPHLHAEVEDALRDAVDCFRHELYTPALAMLAKASEGAWLELGSALLKALPAAAQVSAKKIDKELNDPWVSVAKKIQTVLTLYDHSGLMPVKEKCRVHANELKAVLNWSDVVRESRNEIHYGVQPPTANTYEKLAALLLGAVPHLRVIYRVHDSAALIANEYAVAGA